jgi:glycosyltransferase involved in cell wall biosynthesis
MLKDYTSFFFADGRVDTELIVVVNGSIDRTEELVREFAKDHKNVRIIVEPECVGKGAAVMMGITAVRGEYGGFVDADGATAPAAFQRLIDHRKDADCIIASRYMKGSVAEPKQSLKRRFASRVFNLLVRIMFGLRLTDTQCGAKLIRKDALDAVLPHLGLTQWAFDVDLLFQLKRRGYTIHEIPTVWRDVAGSKLKIGRASITMLVSMSRMRLLHSPLKWIIPFYNKTIGKVLPYARMRK